MSNLVPIGWAIYNIKDVALLSDRYSFTGGPFGSNLKLEDYTGHGVRIIQLQNIGDGQFKNKYKIYTSEEKANELHSCNIYPNDIIMSKMGDPVARAAIMPDYASRYLMASDGIRLAVDNSKFDTKFIHDTINSVPFRSQAEINSTGSTRKRIGLTELRQLTFIAPPLPEQKQIAKILTSVDEVIEKTQAQIDKLKDLKTGMMQELLTNGIGHTEFKDSSVGKIPAEWEVVQLGDKVKLIPGYAFNSSDFVSAGIPLIRMGNLYQNKLSLSRAPKYLPLGFIEKHNKFVIKENDIVFSMTGTSGKEDYGFAVKIPESSPLCLLNQRVAKVVAGDGLIVSFLLHLMHSRTFLNEIYAVGTGTKQANLSSAHILNVELAFPPLKEQSKIASALDSVSDRISVIKEKLAQLNNTKKALMQDLLTGKVRVKLDEVS